MFARFACVSALLLALAAVVAAQDVAAPPVSAPAVASPPGADPAMPPGPLAGPGCASPFGFWTPSPYHPIYDYLPTWDSFHDRYGYDYNRRYGYDRYYDRYGTDGPRRTGKYVEGRDQLYPALPYSDYLRYRAGMGVPGEAETRPQAAADRALIEVRVANESARVWFDDKLAAGDGTTRYFSTPALQPGKEYKFKIKAASPGPDPFQDVITEQTVSFRAGDHKVVDLRPKR
jgi:uncharacterized protein (TIGR03000 family)